MTTITHVLSLLVLGGVTLAMASFILFFVLTGESELRVRDWEQKFTKGGTYLVGSIVFVFSCMFLYIFVLKW